MRDHHEIPVRVILTDLDGTIYPAAHPHANALRAQTKKWMTGRLGYGVQELDELYERLSRRYPNPLRGLAAIGLDVMEYHREVFDLVDPARTLEPDSALAGVLADVPVPIMAVTLSSPKYAERLLAALGIAQYFETVMTPCLGWTDKVDCYRQVISDLGVSPESCLVVGDSWAIDIEPALSLGCQAAWIHSQPSRQPLRHGLIHAPKFSAVPFPWKHNA